jgi:hypothetical protein
MDVSGYTTDDLILFRRVLDRAIAEADRDMPVELMARRLFVAARGGERDPDQLVAAVLGRGEFPAQLSRFSPPPIPAYIPHPDR